MTSTPANPAPDPQDRPTETSPATSSQPTPAAPTRRRRPGVIAAAAILCGALFGGVAFVIADGRGSDTTALDAALDDVTPRQESAVDDADIGVEIDRQLEAEAEAADQEALEALNAEAERFAQEDQDQLDREIAEQITEEAAAEERTTAVLGDTPGDVQLGVVCLRLYHALAESGYPSAWKASGTVAGAADGTTVVVQGPTINDGQPVAAEVVDERFEATLGVRQYGEHRITRLEAVDPTDEVTSLLDDALEVEQISDGEHIVLPVGPEEGAVFGQECFTIDVAPPDEAGPLAAGEFESIQAFLDRLVELHADQDTAGLAELLDPRIVAAFGEQACNDQLVRVTGSLLGLRIVSIDGRGPFTLETAVGPIGFDDVVTVTVDMTTTEGEHRQQINLPVQPDGGWTWLTYCD